MHSRRGFIIPVLTWIFNKFSFVSPLTWIRCLAKRFGRSWGWSPLFVEIYVLVTFSLLCFFVWWVYISELLCVAIAGYAIWRLVDILQAWFNTFKDPDIQASSSLRSLVLAAINYLELTMIFGLLAFFFRHDNFYPEFANIRESLRYSIGVITTMGSHFDPASWVGGIIYYSEIAFGLSFLVVIVTRILSYFK